MAAYDPHPGCYLTGAATVGDRVSMKVGPKQMLTIPNKNSSYFLSGSPIMWEQLSVTSQPQEANHIRPLLRQQRGHPGAVRHISEQFTAKAMLRCKAFLPGYMGESIDEMELTEARGRRSDLGSKHRQHQGATAEDEDEFEEEVA